MRERARKLAQEMVLFGHLKGTQWDGLTTLLVAFAESEVQRAAPPSVGTPHETEK